nr:PREDICTED: multidrug resistance-associated protein 7 [Bemisia tabaci]
MNRYSDINWTWNWTEFCGQPEGFVFWDQKHGDLGDCFQKLVLHFPVLCLISIISGYYCGRDFNYAFRSRFEMNMLRVRYTLTFFMALLPVSRVILEISTVPLHFAPVLLLFNVTQCFAMLLHFCYILCLRHRLSPSHRGPVLMNAIWSVYFIITFIALRSQFIIYKHIPSVSNCSVHFYSAVISAALQLLYLLTLLPSSPSNGVRRYQQFWDTLNDENFQSTRYHRFDEDLGRHYLGEAMEGWGPLAKLFFTWVNPLIEKGASEDIKHADDLFDLPVSMAASVLCEKFDHKLYTVKLSKPEVDSRDEPGSFEEETETLSKEQVYNVSLIRALFRSFGKPFFGIGILKLIADCSGFLGPLLLYRLVSFIETKTEPIQYGYYYASALAVSSVISAFCSVHFSFMMAKVKLKIRGAFITTIYKKTLTLNSLYLNKFSTGEIINFMSTDTDRVVNLCPSFHEVWSIPFQIGVIMYMLYTHIGLAFISGVVFSCLIIPMNKVIASKIGSYSTLLMSHKDKRVNLMSQILHGIRVIKMHVWEDHFASKVKDVRGSELKYLKYRKYLDALCVFFWATTPVLMSVLTFSTFVLMGGKLNAATVFTCVSLLHMLIMPLNALPWVLNGLTEAWVSIKRIQKLFEMPDLDYGNFYNCVTGMNSGTLIIEDGCFSWGSKHFRLENINISAKKGQFIGVAGQVGSGKSSLLFAILAELEKHTGIVATSELENGIAVVTQSPWLQNGTIRENILFGKAFDQTRYKAVISACALDEDLEVLPGGDEANVGEGGFMLSGGQKARVSLARAIYQDKLLYLLDDVLSAVDNHVALHIYQHVINGLLKNKTRILVTHQTQYLLSADRIIFLKNGRIEKEGKPSEVLPDYEEHLLSSSSFRDPSDASSSSREHKDVIKRVQLPPEHLEGEVSEIGGLAFSVYARYWKAIGHTLALLILLSILCMQVLRNSTDFWLAYWVTNEGNTSVVNASYDQMSTEYILSEEYFGNDADNYFNLEYLILEAKHRFSYYLTVYVSLCGANCIIALLRAFSFAYGGVKAASKIHAELFSTIMKARTEFFDLNPLGRILNRFSSDVYTIDDSLPFILNIFLAATFSLLGALTLTVYSLPWLCLILAPLIPIYLWLQNSYRLASRELKRLSTTTLSPVYSHFSETLAGLSTIRAFRALPRFRRENEFKLENNQKTQFASASISAWLQLRLQLMSIAMIIGTGFIAILQHHFDTANPGLVGLAISSALTLTGLVSNVLNVFTETEMELISVERVSQYIKSVKRERKWRYPSSAPYGWPSLGVVGFHHAELRYREHLVPSLKDICFETRPAEKIGVVGRTGSGKSSLFVALFRMVELTSGKIVIDAVNIAKLSLKQLRSQLAIIPQNPFIFSGSIRENIDPLTEHQDSEIWTALQRCCLHNTVKRLGGLSVELGENGVTLSAGQKQLLCLVRAVLHNAKVLCIDEATANVDEETDRCIQGTIQTSFRQSTVITIAHRVATIMDSDRVLVLDDGCVKEFDAPQTLLQNKESYFYKLANQDFQ